MKVLRRSLAAAELLLIFPAALFMTALFLRSIQPRQFEPAHSAQRIVDWYASSVHIGLWVMLIALPFAVLTIGCATLVRMWRRDAALREAFHAVRAHFATLLIAIATVAAAAILAVVAVHLITG
jgi:hypothetical protein